MIGIGNSWLLAEPHRDHLMEMLRSGCEVTVLVPDPFSSEVIERYKRDEPPTAKLGLNGLARNIIKWHELQKDFPSLRLKVFNRYPVVNVSIYDHHVYASSVLYQQRGIENLTVIFRRPSQGAKIYEGHFDQVYNSGSTEITFEYLEQIREKFNL